MRRVSSIALLAALALAFLAHPGRASAQFQTNVVKQQLLLDNFCVANRTDHFNYKGLSVTLWYDNCYDQYFVSTQSLESAELYAYIDVGGTSSTTAYANDVDTGELSIHSYSITFCGGFSGDYQCKYVADFRPN